MISQAAIDEVKARNPCDKLAGKWVKLRRHPSKKGKKIGPCPLHSRNPNAGDSTSFECDADGWVCAVCQDGGDVIKLLRKRENLDFEEAIEQLGGAQILEHLPDPEKAKAREKELEAKRAKADRDAQTFRERERHTAYDIWKHAGAFDGSSAEAYLKLRGLIRPPGCALRCVEAMPYWLQGADRGEIIHRGPAMIAPIIGLSGKFAGLHLTYVDLAQPKGKVKLIDPENGKELPAKKVRGSKRGGHIDVFRDRDTAELHGVVLAEGIEKAIAFWMALDGAGRDVTRMAFWVASDLGNIAGKSAKTVPHPTLRDERGRVRRVPGPAPDPEATAIAIPDSVTELVLLGDSTSDRFTTQCTMARAAARYQTERRRVRVAWAPEGLDFDDMIREAA